MLVFYILENNASYEWCGQFSQAVIFREVEFQPARNLADSRIAVTEKLRSNAYLDSANLHGGLFVLSNAKFHVAKIDPIV